MNSRFPLPAILACLLACTACAQSPIRNDAPRSLPAQGPVSVSWEDPERFTEIRRSHNPTEARRGNWVEQLAQHLRVRAQARMPVGERLEVVFTDIERAGEFEPWRGIQFQDTRIVRELYPPHIDLRFRHLGADGTVLAEGERSLTDGGFLMRGSPGDSDLLRFEKRLLDDWLRREFPTAR